MHAAPLYLVKQFLHFAFEELRLDLETSETLLQEFVGTRRLPMFLALVLHLSL